MKIRKGWLELLKLRNFQCIGGGTLHAFFYLVSGLQCMGKRVAWMQERWKCSVMFAFMGGMLGQRAHLKARRPALAYANVRLYIFFFIVFIRSAIWGRKWGVY